MESDFKNESKKQTSFTMGDWISTQLAEYNDS